MAQTNSPLEPQCSSGNCKFPGFTTMGICSRCEDVTSHANQTFHTSEELISFNAQSGWIYLGTARANCPYTLPNGQEITEDNFASGTYPNVTTITFNYWSIRPLNGSTIIDIEQPIFSFLVTNHSTEIKYVPEHMTVYPPKPLFLECGFNYCEKQYSPSHYLISNAGPPSANVSKTQALIPRDSHSLINKHVGDAIVFRAPSDTPFMSRNISYSMDYYTYSSLSSVLQGIFNTTLESAFKGIGSGGIMEPILRGSNIGQLLESMSTGMTDTMRANSRATRIPGKGLRNESFIQVRWPWIILPICVIVGLLALLWDTASVSKRQQAVLWKSSVLPLMMSQLETSSERLLSERNVDEVHRLAKHVDVSMCEDGGPLISRGKLICFVRLIYVWCPFLARAVV